MCDLLLVYSSPTFPDVLEVSAAPHATFAIALCSWCLPAHSSPAQHGGQGSGSSLAGLDAGCAADGLCAGRCALVQSLPAPLGHYRPPTWTRSLSLTPQPSPLHRPAAPVAPPPAPAAPGSRADEAAVQRAVLAQQDVEAQHVLQQTRYAIRAGCRAGAYLVGV